MSTYLTPNRMVRYTAASPSVQRPTCQARLSSPQAWVCASSSLYRSILTGPPVGYPESLTDPSYRGQILVFTQPLIGNYGVPSSVRDEYGLLKYFESPYLQAAGVVVADYAEQYSHWTAVESLGEWCARSGVPAITGVDTRDVVTFLREQGSSLGRITVGEEYDADEDEAFIDPEGISLVNKVTTQEPFHVSSPSGDLHIALIDCGVKENILRSIVSFHPSRLLTLHSLTKYLSGLSRRLHHCLSRQLPNPQSRTPLRRSLHFQRPW